MPRPFIALLAAAALALLAGCGGGSNSTVAELPSEESRFPLCDGKSGEELEGCEAVEEQELEEAEELNEPEPAADAPPPESEEVGGPLEYIGTITASDGEGTTFRNKVSIGPLAYSEEGAPAQEELEAVASSCNANNPALMASTAFLHEELAATYLEGTLPLTLTADPFGFVKGDFGGLSLIVIELDGAWQCLQSTDTYVEVQPGESPTYSIWLLMPVLTNAEPRLSQSVQDSMYVQYFGPTSFSGSSWEKITGPGRTLCENGEEFLYLFNRSGEGCGVEEGY